MKTNLDFAKSLIESSQLREQRRRLREEEELEFKDELEFAPEEEKEEEIKNPDGFEEELSDKVYWCDTCHKHFLASEETPESEIACPVCDTDEVKMIFDGVVEDDMDEDEEEEELEVEDFDDMEESVRFKKARRESTKRGHYFNESSLNEGLTVLAKRHINSKARACITSGQITKEGNLVLKGRVSGKPMTVTFEGFRKNLGKKKFVCEGTSNMFKKTKLKALFVKEGRSLKVKSFGYGLIRESASGIKKFHGKVGEK